MYTQSFSVPDGSDDAKSVGLKAVPKALSAQDTALQAAFDARIDADGRIELIHGLAFLAARDAAKAAREDAGRGSVAAGGEEHDEEHDEEGDEAAPWLVAPIAFRRIAQ